jgi:hypothetical protein
MPSSEPQNNNTKKGARPADEEVFHRSVKTGDKFFPHGAENDARQIGIEGHGRSYCFKNQSR